MDAILKMLEHLGLCRPKDIIQYLQLHRQDGISTPRIKHHLSNLYKEKRVIILTPEQLTHLNINIKDGRGSYYALPSILQKQDGFALLLAGLKKGSKKRQQNILHELMQMSYRKHLSPDQLSLIEPILKNKKHMNNEGWYKALQIIATHLSRGILPSNLAEMNKTTQSCYYLVSKSDDKNIVQSIQSSCLQVLALSFNPLFVEILQDEVKLSKTEDFGQKFKNWIFSGALVHFEKVLLNLQLSLPHKKMLVMSEIRQTAIGSYDTWKHSYKELYAILSKREFKL